MQAFAAQVRTLWTRAAARLPGGERTLLCLTLGLVAFTVRVAYQ